MAGETEFPEGARADGLPAALSDPARLAAVRATGLLDTGPEPVFEDLATLAARITGAGRAFVTLVDEERSYWKSCVGVDVTGGRETPVRESFCYFLVGFAGDPFMVEDAAHDPRTRDHPGIGPMKIGAWAGYPLLGPDGEVLGSFCVVDEAPRAWTTADRATLATLSRSASAEIHLRQSLAASQHAHRLSADLAHTLQRGLLPPALRPVPGLDAAAAYVPASASAHHDVTVGGDFYDLFHAAGPYLRRLPRRRLRQGRRSGPNHLHGPLHAARRRRRGPLPGAAADPPQHRHARPGGPALPDRRPRHVPPHPLRRRRTRLPRGPPAAPGPPRRRPGPRGGPTRHPAGRRGGRGPRRHPLPPGPGGPAAPLLRRRLRGPPRPRRTPRGRPRALRRGRPARHPRRHPRPGRRRHRRPDHRRPRRPPRRLGQRRHRPARAARTRARLTARAPTAFHTTRTGTRPASFTGHDDHTRAAGRPARAAPPRRPQTLRPAHRAERGRPGRRARPADRRGRGERRGQEHPAPHPRR
ncbi:putative serine/threonine protein phosphatase [Streptomyces sp. PVA_94-07]|nr:putative serine/threonine protein phosphatase [Streptomyces sp. PVA_94-07]